MFEWLKNFGDWFFDLVQALVQFVMSLINGLITMIKSFPMIMQITTESVSYVPSIFAVFITITISIYIVYLIIGRSAGGSDD